MKDQNQSKVRDLFADSAHESAKIEKLNLMYYYRESHDSDESLDEYLQKKSEEKMRGSEAEGIIEKITSRFNSPDQEATEKECKDRSHLEGHMFFDFVNKLKDTLDGDKIEYILTADTELASTSEDQQPSIESELWERSGTLSSYIRKDDDYATNFSGYRSVRWIITSNKILVFTPSHRRSNITEDSEWLLATEVTFQDIEEVEYYYHKQGKNVLITTEGCALRATFYTSCESKSDIESAIDYIGTEAELEPRLESSRNMDPHAWRDIKHDLFNRKEQVKHWNLQLNNQEGIKWGIERRLDLSDIKQSRQAHESARGRSPPVNIGDVEKMGVIDFTTHHQKGLQAVCEVENFKIFVQDIPQNLEVGDILSAKIVSYGNKKTSANAIFEKDHN